MVIWVVKLFFVWFFCVFFLPLINIFCFCYVHTISVLYCAHLCMKYSLGISNFLEEISSLPHSIIFLYFFALITEEGFLISPSFNINIFQNLQFSCFPTLSPSYSITHLHTHLLTFSSLSLLSSGHSLLPSFIISSTHSFIPLNQQFLKGAPAISQALCMALRMP